MARMKHGMGSTLLAGCWLLLAGMTPAQSLDGLDDYLAHAEAHHPALEAARSRTETLRQEASVAGALPDLKLAWGEMIVPVETRVGPQQRVLSLSQSLPWFGTLGSAATAADLRAAAGDMRRQEAQLDVRRDVYQAWFEVARLQAEQDLVQRKLTLLRQEEATARAAYESGSVPYSGLVRLQMTLRRLQTRLLTLEDAMGPATSSLALAAGLPADFPPSPRAQLPSRPDVLPERAELASRLRAANPALESLRLQEQSFGHDVETARLRGRPGLTLGLDYIMTGEAAMAGTQDSGKDPVVARVAVSLPLWSGKATAQRQASIGRRETAAAQRRRLELDLEDRLQRTLFRLRDADRQLALLTDDLLPAARRLEEAARADYETGRAGFADFLAAGRDILDLETEILRHEADMALALVDLDILLGGEGDAFLAYPGD